MTLSLGLDSKRGGDVLTRYGADGPGFFYIFVVLVHICVFFCIFVVLVHMSHILFSRKNLCVSHTHCFHEKILFACFKKNDKAKNMKITKKNTFK